MPEESLPDPPPQANKPIQQNQPIISTDFREEVAGTTVNKPLPKARVQMELYIPIILLIWAYSFLIPAVGVYYYFHRWIIPNISQFLQISVVLGDWSLMLLVALSPLVILGAFFLRILGVIFLSKGMLKFCNWRSPHIELISAKGIGKEEAKAINYYHVRGVILRIMKWEVSKSIFPWLVPWAFNFVGANKIGKGTILEDQFFTQEFLETGENVYIGQGSIVSSHLVEGKYGAITLKRVKCGNNTVIGPFNAIPPGSELEPYTELLPMSGILKFRKVKGYAKYFGLPIGKISYKRYIKMLQIPEQQQELILNNKILKILHKKREHDRK